jgi:hypothetical protein
MKTILTAVFVLVTVQTASAEWGLYVNRNGKAWVIEQTFAFESETDRNCKAAARTLWLTGTVKGVTCQEYAATSYAQRSAPAGSQWAPAPDASAVTYKACASNGACVNNTYKAENDGQGITVTKERSYTAGRGDGSGMAAGTTKPFTAGSISGTYRGSR